MAIVSLEFAAFVAVVLVVHHQLAARLQRYWLLLASYAFYALSAPQFVAILLLATLANYTLGARLAPGYPRRALWLWLGLTFNVAVVAALRYAYRSDPFAGPFAVLGLSFYALQAMSYLLDMHAATLKTRGTLADVALYLAYFPKLVAGPIERARSFLPQLANPRPVDNQTIACAATLIAVGVTRKVVIADPLRALLPPDAFSAPSESGAAVLAAAIIGYAFVLYNDFAGYTSIARGVSGLFGIELSPNFVQPFFARSLTDFWNRWHVTLSHWLRDYVYLPLSRALLRRNPSLWNVPNLLLPPLVTMLASGLWHGGSAHMLVWGGLHGVYLVAERVLFLAWPATPGRRRGVGRLVAAALTVFVLGCWALVAFRMETAVALSFWGCLLGGTSGPLPDGRMLVFLVTSLWLDRMQERHGDTAAFLRLPRVARAALLALAMLLWFLATRQQSSAPFIYRGF